MYTGNPTMHAYISNLTLFPDNDGWLFYALKCVGVEHLRNPSEVNDKMLEQALNVLSLLNNTTVECGYIKDAVGSLFKDSFGKDAKRKGLSNGTGDYTYNNQQEQSLITPRVGVTPKQSNLKAHYEPIMEHIKEHPGEVLKVEDIIAELFPGSPVKKKFRTKLLSKLSCVSDMVVEIVVVNAKVVEKNLEKEARVSYKPSTDWINSIFSTRYDQFVKSLKNEPLHKFKIHKRVKTLPKILYLLNDPNHKKKLVEYILKKIVEEDKVFTDSTDSGSKLTKVQAWYDPRRNVVLNGT